MFEQAFKNIDDVLWKEAGCDELDLRSHDVTEGKQAELLRLFPEIRSEGGKNDWEKDGKNIALERCLLTHMAQRGSAVVV